MHRTVIRNIEALILETPLHPQKPYSKTFDKVKLRRKTHEQSKDKPQTPTLPERTWWVWVKITSGTSDAAACTAHACAADLFSTKRYLSNLDVFFFFFLSLRPNENETRDGTPRWCPASSKASRQRLEKYFAHLWEDAPVIFTKTLEVRDQEKHLLQIFLPGTRDCGEITVRLQEH